jgi:FtsH-binding integral membrane protein
MFTTRVVRQSFRSGRIIGQNFRFNLHAPNSEKNVDLLKSSSPIFKTVSNSESGSKFSFNGLEKSSSVIFPKMTLTNDEEKKKYDNTIMNLNNCKRSYHTTRFVSFPATTKLKDKKRSDKLNENTKSEDVILQNIVLQKIEDKVEEKVTAGEVVSKSNDLQLYFKKVNLTTGKFLGTTALTGAGTIGLSYAMLKAGLDPEAGMILFGGGLIGSFLGSLYHAWQIDQPGKTEQEQLKHAYWMQGFMGIAISPSLIVFNQFIPHALITTAALVGGPVFASFMMPNKSMLKYGPALYTGLLGLLGVGVTSILAPILGFHNLGMMMHNIDLYGGVLLFTIYNAYDTHVLIDNYQRGIREYVKHSVNYSLNAINIFIRLLEIYAKLQKKK